MHHKNREGFAEYNINPRYFCDRGPGISAMLRVRNEEEFLPYCLESIRWFDEIVICFQNSTDESERIAKDFAKTHPDTRIYHYPFDSFPNGPGHDRNPEDSVYSRAYFYNWCLHQTTRRWVCKWDGDMVAMDWLGGVAKIFTRYPHSQNFCLTGMDMCSLGQTCKKRYVVLRPGLFRVTPETYWVNGSYCEKLRGQERHEVYTRPAFLHFKWAKPWESATSAWPECWQSMRHFQEIISNKQPGEAYAGEYPSVLNDQISMAHLAH